MRSRKQMPERQRRHRAETGRRNKAPSKPHEPATGRTASTAVGPYRLIVRRKRTATSEEGRRFLVQSGYGTKLFVAGPLRLRRPLGHDVTRILTHGKSDVEPADHHFFPTLVAPLHFLGGVGIGLVGRGVVKVRGTLQLGSLGQILLLG